MRFVTAGESHGPALTTIITGVPAGIALTPEFITAELARRQQGYGRGGRMRIETDTAHILSGVRFGKTLGTPITIQIENHDHANWTDRMGVEGEKPEGIEETTPRPGHADLVGTLKIGSDDARDILERASARETAARVAAGAVAKALLAEVCADVFSFVRRIGEVELKADRLQVATELDTAEVEDSPVRCPDTATSQAMCEAIDAARAAGESLGGEFVVVAWGLVPGLGGYATAEDRLTSRIGGALFGIPAIKGVEFGRGFEVAALPGSKVHDEITLRDCDTGRCDESCKEYARASNNAGGLEGGMTNGELLVATAAMKPIPTLMTPLKTIDLKTAEVVEASKERSDVCAVPAAAVVGEAEVAFVLANAYCEKFGADSIEDMKAALDAYQERIAR